MDSHANGQANGNGAAEPPEPRVEVSPPEGDDLDVEFRVERPPAPPRDERAYYGDAFPTAGAWLAARREALGLTLEDVEAATRVREDYLAAIEDMDPRRMPSGPYTPGFVRTYAIHLDLDPDAVTARFREEMSPRRLRPAPTPTVEAPPAFQISIGPRVWAVLFGALAIAAIYALARRGGEEDRVLVPVVPQDLAEWAAAEVQGRRSSAAPEVVIGPDLGLRARVPVWIEARAPDGDVLISRTLEAGEVWTAPREIGIVVSTDNGGAIEVLLDGHVQERLGPPGLPLTNWRADSARELVVPEPVVEVVPEVTIEDLMEPTADEAAGEVAAADTDAAEILEEIAAEEALVTPDLPSEPEISVEALPPIIVGDGGFVPDPEETAAAEGRVVD